MRKNNNNKGYILLETSIFILILSVLCISLSMLIGSKVALSKKDKVKQNLYITAKSTLNVLANQFSENKDLMKEYAQKNETGILKIENRKDISYIQFNIFEDTSKLYAILEVTVFDNNKNKLTLKTEINY